MIFFSIHFILIESIDTENGAFTYEIVSPDFDTAASIHAEIKQPEFIDAVNSEMSDITIDGVTQEQITASITAILASEEIGVPSLDYAENALDVRLNAMDNDYDLAIDSNFSFS